MNHFLTPFILLISLLCFGCPSQSTDDITASNWQLKKWSAGQLPDDLTITAIFADDRLSGRAVCNQYFADAKVENNTVQIQTVGATKMRCPEHNDLERNYFEYLRQASSFKIDKEQLIVNCGEVTLFFVPQKEN